MDWVRMAALAALFGCPTPPPETPGLGTLSESYVYAYYGYYSYYSGYYGSYGSGGTFYSGDPSLTVAQVGCQSPDLVTAYAETVGWSLEGRVYLESRAAGTAENHDLWSFDFAPDGSWDRLRMDLNPVGLYQRDVSTALTCEDAASGAITLAVAVFDLDGELADCVVAGPDAVALVSGALAPVAAPEVSLAFCSPL